MVFFRVKRIKGKEYVYRVENAWKGNTSRQKVKGYLGRAFRFIIGDNFSFSDFCRINDIEKYLKENNNEKIIRDLIEWELARHQVLKSDFQIDIDNKKIKKDGNDVTIIINGGYMCEFTLRNLLDFRTENEEEDGHRLARAFVEAGIKVPEEIFIGLFGKLYREL